MAIRGILKYPDPFLKKKTKPVEKIDDEIRTLIDDMVETMYSAKGIGLAANQVGVDKSVVVLDVPDGDDRENYEKGKNLVAVINPLIVAQDGEIIYEEGCLSIPDFTADVNRFERIVVSGIDRHGKGMEIKAEGLFAIALQHEIDHLNGILFIDRLSRLKREFIKKKILKSIKDEEKRL
ncbi:MAG: peptide deformylase [Deltaproteobacteria bacterium GWC2_42_11]|nr:MAG: peptide deformylase [Deltaproteobacteria bacterium GWC2_42_11]HBO83599.1 peptide deformylase [Deltaproteobacteria bacterium]